MKTTMYRDERICHLEKYAENMPINGIYKGKPYSHILKIDLFQYYSQVLKKLPK